MGVDPFTLSMAMAATSAVQGISAYQQGRQADKVAQSMAAQAEAAGYEEAAAERRRGNMLIGSQIANFGAMGMDPLGNALDVLQMTAMENELQAQTIITNARFQAFDYRQQGKAAKAQGFNQMLGSFGQSAGSVMLGMKGSGSASTKAGTFFQPGEEAQFIKLKRA